MKRSVIDRYGLSSQGKSETISETANLLLTAFPNHIRHAINTNADIIYVIDSNSIKIGLERQGDSNSRIFQSLQTFVAQGFDIIIYSCSSKGATAWRAKVEDLPAIINTKSFGQPITAHGIKTKRN